MTDGMNGDWESFLAANLVGYLLPEAAAHALSEEAAARFLARLAGRPDALRLLRLTSLLVPRRAALERFVLVELPSWARALPARTVVRRRIEEGAASGRLDVARTAAEWRAGRRTRFVTRGRERRFDLPENLLVCHVARRLRDALAELRQAGVGGDAGAGWQAPLGRCEAALERLLAEARIAALPEVAPSPIAERAARGGRHPCYRLALGWLADLRRGLDSSDPALIASLVARGALLPLAAATRFELAVLVRLVAALEARLAERAPGRWRLVRGLIEARRHAVAALVRDDGAALRLFYNQAELSGGPYERGAAHYFGHRGRLRPDLTLVVERDGRACGAVLVEAKHSSDPAYLFGGYQEALLYRWEYAAHLTGWPKAILVTSAPLPGGLPERAHEVVACDWARWVPAEILDGILAPLADA